MRKLYRELFYIPKYGTVSEKKMLVRMVSTVATVVCCLLALSFTAFAYFSANITSGANRIQSATFRTKVQVRITDQAGKAVETVTPITSDYKAFRIEGLTVGQHYTVCIEPLNSDTAAQTGFVIVSADEEACAEVYHTQQLGVDESVEGGRTEALTFRLVLTDATNVYLRAHWGTSSYYPDYQNKNEKFYITQGETVTMIVNGYTEPNIPDNSPTSAPTAVTKPVATTEAAAPKTEVTQPAATETAASAPAVTTEPSTEAVTAAPTAQSPTETALTEAATAATELPTGEAATALTQAPSTASTAAGTVPASTAPTQIQPAAESTAATAAIDPATTETDPE